MHILIQLFLTFFYIGSLSFGGGMSSIPLVEHQIVDRLAWLDYDSFIELITIAEMTPGPIAINTASFIGARLAGPVGALVATIASITPAIIIVSIVAYVFFKNKDISLFKNILLILRPFIIILILSAGINILTNSIFRIPDQTNIINIVVFLLSFVFLKKFKLPPIVTMLILGLSFGVITTIF